MVGVMGGSEVSDAVEKTAGELGRRIAERGWILLNGGRDEGVMRASARGAHRAEGTVIGVLPGASEADEAVAENVTHRIFTGMGDARNVVNVLSSDVIVACRGGVGTLSEVAHAVNAGTPVVLVDWPKGHVPDQLDAGTVEHAGSARAAISTVEELLDEHTSL